MQSVGPITSESNGIALELQETNWSDFWVGLIVVGASGLGIVAMLRQLLG